MISRAVIVPSEQDRATPQPYVDGKRCRSATASCLFRPVAEVCRRRYAAASGSTFSGGGFSGGSLSSLSSLSSFSGSGSTAEQQRAAAATVLRTAHPYLLAAEAAQGGASAEDVVALVEDLRTRTRVVGCLDTLENLKKIGTELTADQLPIDCRGKELKFDSPLYLYDMGGDKVDFTKASLLGEPGTYAPEFVGIGSAVGGRFRGSTIATKSKNAGIYFFQGGGDHFQGGVIIGADLAGANFEEASFTTEGGYSPIFFPSANLNGANFDKASLRTSSSYAYISFGKSWYGTGADADLTDASFEKAFLMTGGRNVKGNTDITFSDSTLTRNGIGDGWEGPGAPTGRTRTTLRCVVCAHVSFGAFCV